MFSLQWMDIGGEIRTQMFPSEDEAKDAARRIPGVALIAPASGGPVTVFRNSWELQAADASDAVARFGHKIEVGVSRAEEPETNIDPDDLTGSGWRPGTPAVYGWRVWKPGEGAGPWTGTFWKPEAALAAAEKARTEQAELAGLPIVRIDRSSTGPL